jgi:hypothetical protein
MRFGMAFCVSQKRMPKRIMFARMLPRAHALGYYISPLRGSVLCGCTACFCLTETPNADSFRKA